MFKKSCEGSTEQLLQLCAGYFFSYIGTGVLVKYFTAPVNGAAPIMSDLQYLVYGTGGGSLLCLFVVLVLGWQHMKSDRKIKVLGYELPYETVYIVPSGICTAVVIPTTTLMYLLPISVMVAMIIMRASIIIISRIIDAIQIHQGILKRKVYMEENVAVVFALAAAGVQLAWIKKGDFDFLHNVPAMIILAGYILAYGIRIYIMNYYRNTRPAGTHQDNKGFFAIEQIAAFLTMVTVGLILYYCACGSTSHVMTEYRASFDTPHKAWLWAVLAGSVYGLGAFFSVFLFMFKGRTATFAGLVNRLTSLVAGTVATLIAYYTMGSKPPKAADWIALGFILIAVYFLGVAEKKRVAELQAAKELEKVC